MTDVRMFLRRIRHDWDLTYYRLMAAYVALIVTAIFVELAIHG